MTVSPEADIHAPSQEETRAAFSLGTLASPIIDGLRRFSPTNKNARRLVNTAVILSLVLASCADRSQAPLVDPGSDGPPYGDVQVDPALFQTSVGLRQ